MFGESFDCFKFYDLMSWHFSDLPYEVDGGWNNTIALTSDGSLSWFPKTLSGQLFGTKRRVKEGVVIL